VGSVSITQIVDTESALPCEMLYPNSAPSELATMPWLAPFLDDNGHIRLVIQSFLVRTASRALLVDLCVGNDKPRGFDGFNMLKTDYLMQLETAGVSPADIDTVIYTHLHGDHVGWGTTHADGQWVPTFGNARHLIDRAELDYWSTQQDSPDDRQSFDDSVRPIVDAGLIDYLDEDDYALTPEITIVRTPGHTPGHRSVRIVSGGEEAVISGDIAHNPCQIGRPAWSCFLDYDPAHATHARETMLADAADRGILYIGTHFPHPTAGHIVHDGDTYRFDTDPQQ